MLVAVAQSTTQTDCRGHSRSCGITLKIVPDAERLSNWKRSPPVSLTDRVRGKQRVPICLAWRFHPEIGPKRKDRHPCHESRTEHQKRPARPPHRFAGRTRESPHRRSTRSRNAIHQRAGEAELGHTAQVADDLAVLQGNRDGFLERQIPNLAWLGILQRKRCVRLRDVRQRCVADIGILEIGDLVEVVGQVAVLREKERLRRVAAREHDEDAQKHGQTASAFPAHRCPLPFGFES